MDFINYAVAPGGVRGAVTARLKSQSCSRVGGGANKAAVVTAVAVAAAAVVVRTLRAHFG